VVRRFGQVDVWVNNAGIFPSEADVLTTSAEHYERVLAVNLIGVHNGIKAAAARMIERGKGGVIINVASSSAWRGAGAYSASKWAVRGITHGLAPKLGAHGIRILGVGPTVIDTEGRLAGRDGRPLEEDDPLNILLLDSVLLGRRGVPDDVARVILFLASDAASYMTGISIPIDGGSLVRPGAAAGHHRQAN
jgi:NAD(P)-dependent dehydrogenase (short-subunit alcohol dehydrogenase family)